MIKWLIRLIKSLCSKREIKMATTKTLPFGLPYYRYTDDGEPLFNAKIYAGLPNEDPTIPANRVDILAVQSDGSTVVLSQPVRTNANGLAVDDSSNVAYLKVESRYSIAVYTSNDLLVYEESTVDPRADEPFLYANVAAIVASDNLEIGNYVSTVGYYEPNDGGAATYEVVAAATATADGGSYIDLTGSGLQAKCVSLLDDSGRLLVEKFGAVGGSSIDSAPRLQAVFDWVENNVTLPSSVTVTSTGGIYYLKTPYSGTKPSWMGIETTALLIHDGEKCKIDFNNGTLFIDINESGMAALDNQLTIAQESGDQAFLNIKNIRIDGGKWPSTSDRPSYNIRADYNVMKYSMFENVRCFRSLEDNIKIAGFVILFFKCDNRFAANGRNFNSVVTTVDGDTPTRTAVLHNQCTADYAGLHGIAVTGSNGTTYAGMLNCTVDHCGRDDNGDTITANVATASAYRLSSLFGYSMISCGAEFSTRYLRGTGLRSTSINNAYCNYMGTTEGSTVDANVELDGYCENVSIEAFEEGTTITDIAKKLKLTPPGAFNKFMVIIKDDSILENDIEVDNLGSDSSASSLVIAPWQTWKRGVRNPGGDAKLEGEPSLGRESTEWFDQSLYNPEIEYRFSTSDVVDLSEELVTLTNPTSQGYVGFYVEIIGGRSSGVTAFNPKKYVASAACSGATKTVTSVVEDNTIGDAITFTLAWSGNSLLLECTTNFIVCSVKVKAITRPGSAKQTFRWGA